MKGVRFMKLIKRVVFLLTGILLTVTSLYIWKESLLYAGNRTRRPPRPPYLRNRGNRPRVSRRAGEGRRTPGSKNKFGKFYDIIGFEHVGRQPTTFEIYKTLPSTYPEFQRVNIEEILFYPNNPEIAELTEDALGAKILHLKYSNIKRGDYVLIYYKGYSEKVDRKPPESSGWDHLLIPERKEFYCLSKIRTL